MRDGGREGGREGGRDGERERKRERDYIILNLKYSHNNTFSEAAEQNHKLIL